MKVWIVMWHVDYEDIGIESVHSTKEKAENRKRIVEQDKDKAHCNYANDFKVVEEEVLWQPNRR